MWMDSRRAARSIRPVDVSLRHGCPAGITRVRDLAAASLWHALIRVAGGRRRWRFAGEVGWRSRCMM